VLSEETEGAAEVPGSAAASSENVVLILRAEGTRGQLILGVHRAIQTGDLSGVWRAGHSVGSLRMRILS